MSVDGKAILVFIPFPVMSHLASAVNTAKLLANRDDRISITILLMKLPMDTKITSYTKTPPHHRISFVSLEESKPLSNGPKNRTLGFVESQRGPARDAVAEMIQSQNGRLAGFMLDMFCTPMIDVANELAVPAYLYVPCGSASLGLMLHLQSFKDDHHGSPEDYVDSDVEIAVPTYANPVPGKVLPAQMFGKENGFLEFVRRFRESKGIIINTFVEFEPHAISSLSADERMPPVYPVGPMIQGGGEETEEHKQKREEIIEWLDEQPCSSVVFLCFGTAGHFEADQVKEISIALEQSGLRFLWSLRKPPPKETLEFPGEYENHQQVLPEGFLERTRGVGKVIGWAPQMAVLSHPSVGGFVSHCGWNSTLESIWCGVPVAAWPLYAEQQANAFLLVKEFEMAVEIKIDYKTNTDVIVAAGTIESAIRQLMDPENKIRVKVNELHQKCRIAIAEGGSSYHFFRRLTDNVMATTS